MGVAHIAEDVGRSVWAVAIKLFEAGQFGAEELAKYAPSEETLQCSLARPSTRRLEVATAITNREDVDLFQVAKQAWDNAKAAQRNHLGKSACRGEALA